MKIFVGNLSFDATEADVRKLFEGFGSVASVAIVMDKKGRNSRGFGFLDMPDDEQAKQALSHLHRQEFMGRPLNLEEARLKPQTVPESPRDPRPHPLRGKDFSPQPQGDAGFQRGRRPAIASGSRYKQGRRTKSFMKRRAEAGIEGPVIERKVHDNPMRWRKKKPWQKNRPSSSKPWEGSQGASEKPRGRSFSSKPWEASQGAPPFSQKPGGRHKPWQRSKPSFSSKPHESSQRSSSAPSEKPKGRLKPWQKSSARPKKAGFQKRKKFGAFKR